MNPETPISPDQIAERAYTLWLSRGCPITDGQEDWVKAETELLDEARRNMSAQKVSDAIQAGSDDTNTMALTGSSELVSSSPAALPSVAQQNANSPADASLDQSAESKVPSLAESDSDSGSDSGRQSASSEAEIHVASGKGKKSVLKKVMSRFFKK